MLLRSILFLEIWLRLDAILLLDLRLKLDASLRNILPRCAAFQDVLDYLPDHEKLHQIQCVRLALLVGMGSLDQPDGSYLHIIDISEERFEV